MNNKRFSPARSGDLCLLQGHERRIVCVLLSSPQMASVALTSNEYEMATDMDLRLKAAELGTPYDLLLEADVYFPALQADLSMPIGHISRRMMRLIRRATLDDFDVSVARRRGIPLQGYGDPRWSWKEREADGLQPAIGRALATLDVG